MEQNDAIIDEITALLQEYEAGAASTARVEQPAPPDAAAPPPPPRPPKVGSIIQRSDHVNRRKQEALLAPPPPPPKKRAPHPYERPPRPVQPEANRAQPPTILRPMGPLTSPPIPVEVEPGVIVEIPHFAVYVSRRYKPRTANGRWIVRFTRDERIRYCRRLREGETERESPK